MTIRRVTRYDSPGRIRMVRSPEGFMMTVGKLAKPGIMLYRLADGTEIRELVEEETLQDPVSNASMYGKALTLEHPVDDVTPDNWTELSHGAWGLPGFEHDHEDGPGLYAPVTIHTRTMLDILEDDDGPRELSPGYSVKVDDTPGEHPEFGPYDTRQIPGSRRYNHGALTVAARGGPDLTIRKDSAFEVLPMKPNPKSETAPETAPETTPASEPAPEATRNDGEDKMDAFMKEMRDGMKALSDRMDRYEGKAKDATDEDPEEENPEEDESKKKDSRLDWFKARRTLEEIATRYGVDPDGKDDDALKLEVLKTARPETTRTDSAYVDAALELLADAPGPSASERWNRQTPATRNDADDNAPTFVDPNDLFLKGASKK